jgi:hypothetical protein
MVMVLDWHPAINSNVTPTVMATVAALLDVIFTFFMVSVLITGCINSG